MFPETDLVPHSIGPYHRDLPGPFKVKMYFDGEVIGYCSTESGYLHRGLEKTMELQGWSSLIPYADHVDPDAAVFCELALCLSVESIEGLQVPTRAKYIRMVVCELARISSHLGNMTRVARAVGSETIVHFLLRDREKILDLLELLTGARFSSSYFRYGGVRADVTEGFIERVAEFCELLQVRIKEYNDIFSFNYVFLKRSAQVGVISTELARQYQLTGPVARGAGISFDVRSHRPYSGYDRMDFTVPLGSGEFGVPGDAHDRYLVRLREVNQSLEIIRQCLDEIPIGDYRLESAKTLERVKEGESFQMVESPRGVLGCHVVSDGGARPARVQFRTPSSSALHVLPRVLLGHSLEDLALIIASLDISISEVDR